MDTTQTALKKLTLEQMCLLMAGKDIWNTLDIPEIGLRSVRMSDGPMGIASPRVDERDIALLSPCGVALGASWDSELVSRVGELVGQEAQRCGVDVVLGPNLNLPRSPLAGRSFEMFSEDPLLTAQLGSAWIEGLQQRGIGAAAKHFVANDSETDRQQMNSIVDEQALHEVYLLPFEHAARAQAWAIMTAYNKLNGVHAVEHTELIAMLRRDWKFDGVVLSDWFGTHGTVASAQAGLDLEMPGPPRIYGPALRDAVEAGKVNLQAVEAAAERILRMAEKAGKLGTDGTERQFEADTEAQRALLKEAAEAGFVLLKNRDSLLPLGPDVKTLAVIGPNAQVPCYQGGTFARIAVPSSVATPLESIRAVFSPGTEVVHSPGMPPGYRRPPFEALNVHPPDRADEKGFQVSFFRGHDLSGDPLATEVRNASSLVWFRSMPGIGDLDKPGAIRASTVLMPSQTGRYTFFAGGTGDVVLRLDGEEVIHWVSEQAKADLMGALKRGDSSSAVLHLRAGAPVRIDIEFCFEPGRAQGLWYGCQPPHDEQLFENAIASAKAADAVVLVLGETQESALESVDRCTTRLPEDQLELLEAVTTANPRTTVVLNVAHAVETSWSDRAGAILMTWFPGQEFGGALADVLIGRSEPGGRLPVTFAAREQDYPAFLLDPANGDLRYDESIFVGYRYFAAHAVAPAYAFGEGRGYAEFTWSALRATEFEGSVRLELNVRNVSRRSGKEVVQVYVEGPGVPRQLKGFAATIVGAGESAPVRVDLTTRAFSHWSVEQHAWRMTPGRYEMFVGPSSREVTMRAAVTASRSGELVIESERRRMRG